jgi:putative ABC transport system permease protein
MGEGLFELLGVEPMLGRTFAADEFQPGKNQVLVLSYRLWQQRFGGETNIVGQTVTLDGKPYVIIGVMPPSFRFAPFWAVHAEMWAPLSLADRLNDRGGRSLRVFGRLKAGATREQAQAEMNAICKRLEEAYPESNKGWTVSVDPLHEKAVGNIKPALLVLMSAVVFVLMIACGNVANLMLARATVRRKELAIRAALGAGRWQLFRQLLSESVLLSLLGGLLGLLIAFWGIEALTRFVQERIPRFDGVRIDMATLGFTLLVSFLTGMIFGLAPAVRSSRYDLTETLKESSRGSTEARQQGRLRSALIVSEMAVALVLLVGAGLMMRSYLRLQSVDPGFNPRNLLSFTVSLAGLPEYVGARRETFYRTLLEQIESLPGVQSASAVNHLPLGGDMWTLSIAIEGRPPPLPGESIGAGFRVCRPGYFRTMGITLLKGRDFTERDKLDSPGVAIINETLARQQFPNEEPIGKRITFDDPRTTPKWLTIVGVIKDVKQFDLKAPAINEVYWPFAQHPGYLQETAGHVAYMTVVVRTATNPLNSVKPIEKILFKIDRNLPVSNVASAEQVMASAVWQPRFNLSLIGVFAAVGLVLATVGIYGVISYSVSQRTHEIGIRIALGAARYDVLKLVIHRGMLLAVLGVGIGLGGSAMLTRLMRTQLFDIPPTDPLTFAWVSALLLAVALIACLIPARRAAKVDPMEALRYE